MTVQIRQTCLPSKSFLSKHQATEPAAPNVEEHNQNSNRPTVSVSHLQNVSDIYQVSRPSPNNSKLK